MYDYVRQGANVTADFSSPDNLALDKAGNLFIAEDPAVNPQGADIWMAAPGAAGQHQTAESAVRFASLRDCAAEPTGIYFDQKAWALFVHVQHSCAPDTRGVLLSRPSMSASTSARLAPTWSSTAAT